MSADQWATAAAELRTVDAAQTAWEQNPSPETGRSLQQALTRAATAVGTLYQRPARPTSTGCTRHPTGPVDYAGLDDGEGPCLRCNQDRRRAAAAQEAARNPLPRRQLGRRGIPSPRRDGEADR